MLGESMLITRTVQNRPHRWVTVAASLLFHSFFIAALIVAPLMDADAEMPSLTIETIFLSTPPPPAPPPPPVGGNGNDHTGTTLNHRPKETTAPKVLDPGKLVTPVVVPEEIPEEALKIDFGPQSGSGIIGAATGWGEEDDLTALTEIIGDKLLNQDQVNLRPEGFTMKPPKLMHNPSPPYPPLALKTHVWGTVTIQAETDIYGRVSHTDIISGHPLLMKAAEEAVKKWRYEPFIINGIPRPVKFIVEVKFTLNQR